MDKFTHDTIEQYHELLEEEAVALRQSFEILDEVFAAFVKTNQHWGEKWSWKNILDYDSEHKAHFRYWHSEIPYRATIFALHDVEGLWLNIKLANNGFVYFPKLSPQTAQYGHNRWVALRAKDYLKNFPNLLRIVDSENWKWQSVAIFYNAFMQRIDIKLRGTGLNVLITYEPGFPFEEEEQYYENREDLIQS